MTQHQHDTAPAVPREPGLVPLLDDEYLVGWPDGKHRAPGNPDPVRTATATAANLGAGLAQGVQIGVSLFRAAATVGLRIVGLRGGPLAIDSGPIGRAAAAVTPVATIERIRRDRDQRPAAPTVAVRSGGVDVDLEPEGIDTAFPHATDRLVVFLPAAGQEDAWTARREDVGGTYGSRLAQLLDWTPVHVGTDGAFPIPDNGVAVSAALQRLVEGWPVDLRRIALVGHGAGGLVLRAAAGVRTLGETVWTDLVSDVIVLDTPHLASTGPSGLPVDPVRLARMLDERLAGITGDAGADLDVPPLPHARYQVVNDAATTSKHAMGRALGGLLWWRQTATGRARQAWALFPTATHHVLSTRDYPLANHPEVHRGLLGWLA